MAREPDSESIGSREDRLRARRRLVLGLVLAVLALTASGSAGNDVERFAQLWSFGFGYVASVDYSPDGSQIAAGAAGTIFLINAKTYEIERLLAGHTGIIWSVKWSPDGKYLASGSEDTTVKVWEVETRSVVITLEGHTRLVYSVTWSPDGKYLASGSFSDFTRVWEVASGMMVKTLPAMDFSVAWSPNGDYLAGGAGDRFPGVRVWNVATWTVARELTGHPNGVKSMAWSPDSQYLASGGNGPGSTLNLWEVETGNLLWSRIPLQGREVDSVAWEPAGALVAAGGGARTTIWAADTGELVQTLGNSQSFEFRSISWSTDGENITSGGGFGVHTWDVTTGDLLVSLQPGHTGEVKWVSWSPDGRYLVSTAGNERQFSRRTRIWNVETRQEEGTVPDECPLSADSVEWSPAGSYLAMGNVCGVLKVWDMQAGKELWRVSGARVLTDLSWSPDGRFLAVPGRERRNLRTRIRDAQTGEAVRVLDGAGRHIRWSPNGKYLAAVGIQPPNTWMLIWDAETGVVLDRIDEAAGVTIWGLAWSPDGNSLAYSLGSARVIKVWQVQPRKLIREITGYFVTLLSWRSDGHFLAGSFAENGVWFLGLWDVRSGDLITTLSGHTWTVNSLKWSPDGRYLATGSSDRTVRLWGSSPSN